MPLTVIAQLLYLDAASPYRPAKKYGLRNWLTSQVRGFLTRGAAHCVELDLERAIRFNEAYLIRRADFVLGRKQEHRGKPLDGKSFAEILGLSPACGNITFQHAWQLFISSLANELVDISRSGYIEDVAWPDAERYLDQAVVPRTRKLRATGVTADQDYVAKAMMEPLSLQGGYRRFKRILDGLTSKDPKVVEAMEKSWVYLRFAIPSICSDDDWHEQMAALDQGMSPGSTVACPDSGAL